MHADGNNRLPLAERPEGIDLAEISSQTIHTDQGESTVVNYYEVGDYCSGYRQTIHPNGKELWEEVRTEHE
jgi:hypothetical protein